MTSFFVPHPPPPHAPHWVNFWLLSMRGVFKGLDHRFKSQLQLVMSHLQVSIQFLFPTTRSSSKN